MIKLAQIFVVTTVSRIFHLAETMQYYLILSLYFIHILFVLDRYDYMEYSSRAAKTGNEGA